MNTHAGQISNNSPLTILRQPPAVPVSAPIISKPLPALPKSPPEPPSEPPQPPARTRSTLKTQDQNIKPHGNAQQNENQRSPPSTKSQLADASNEAAKLVYKTVMMGSVQNVNEIVDNEKSPHRKKSVCICFF